MKKALVLEGGGMRGLYTCGVLDYFIEKDIEFQMSIGVSAGACAACSFLSKQFGRGAAVNLDYIQDKEYLSLRNLLFHGSAFGMDLIFRKIPDELNKYDYKTFHNNPCAFYAVSTDIETGDALYHRVINMRTDIDYVKASMSLPLLAPVVELDGKKLLDGGIADSIPVEFAFKKGSDKCVVVLTQCRNYRKGKNNLMPIIKHNYRQYPNLVRALEERHVHYNNTLDLLYWLEKEGKVFIIQPQEAVKISRLETDKTKLQALYNDGYEDAKRLYDDLMKFLSE